MEKNYQTLSDSELKELLDKIDERRSNLIAVMDSHLNAFTSVYLPHWRAMHVAPWSLTFVRIDEKGEPIFGQRIEVRLGTFGEHKGEMLFNVGTCGNFNPESVDRCSFAEFYAELGALTGNMDAIRSLKQILEDATEENRIISNEERPIEEAYFATR